MQNAQQQNMIGISPVAISIRILKKILAYKSIHNPSHIYACLHCIKSSCARNTTRIPILDTSFSTSIYTSHCSRSKQSIQQHTDCAVNTYAHIKKKNFESLCPTLRPSTQIHLLTQKQVKPHLSSTNCIPCIAGARTRKMPMRQRTHTTLYITTLSINISKSMSIQTSLQPMQTHLQNPFYALQYTICARSPNLQEAQ